MSLQNCLTGLRSYLDQEQIKLPDSEVRAIAKNMTNMLQSNPNRMTLDVTIEAFEKRMRVQAARWRATQIMDLAKQESSLRTVKLNHESAKISPAESFRNMIEGGGIQPGFETNLDPARIEDFHRASFQKRLGVLLGNNLKRLLFGSELDGQIFQEVDAMERGLKPGLSGSPEAAQIAGVIHSLNQYISSLKVALNPMFERAEGFFTHRTHDAEKIQLAGKSSWVDFMMMNARKSFEGLNASERQAKFGSVYDEIVDPNSRVGVGSRGNLAQRMASSRTILFDNWQSEFNYNKMFGSGTLIGSVLDGISKDARQIAQLEKFGSNPQEWFTNTYNKLLDHFGTGSAEGKELISRRKYLNDSFETARGFVNAPAQGIRAKFVAGSIKYVNWVTTGASVLAALPDLAVAAGSIADSTGRNFMQVTGDLVGHALQAVTSPAEAQRFLEMTNLMTDGYKNTLARELGVTTAKGTGLAGQIQKGVEFVDQTWNTITLRELLHKTQRASVGMVVAKILAQEAESSFKDLNIQGQKGLLRYGIGPEAWEAIRQAKEELPGHGNIMTPEAIHNLPDEVAEKYMRDTGQLTGSPSPALLDLGRSQLATRIGALINEHAQLGSVMGGTRQRAFMFRGYDINSGVGQALRLFWQLKQASLVSSDALRRSWNSGESLRGNMTGIGYMGASMVFMAGLGYYAKQTLQGKSPEEPNPRLAATILANAGLGGPTADIFLHAMERQGISEKVLAGMGSALGPTIGKIAEGAAIGVQSLQNEYMGKKQPRAAQAQFLGDNLPIIGQAQNLFWTRPLWNFAFTNGMKEYMNPGYIGSVTRATQKNNQTYMFFDPRESPRW